MLSAILRLLCTRPARLPFASGCAPLLLLLGNPFPVQCRVRSCEPRDTMIWGLLREEYASTPAATVGTEAFDVLGQRLL